MLIRTDARIARAGARMLRRTPRPGRTQAAVPLFSRVLVVLAASLVACVHGSAYPVPWPALVSSGDGHCPDLTGRYTDRGETFDSPHWISLSGLLLSVRAAQVEISLSDSGELRIHGWTDHGSAGTKSLARSAGDFDCDGLRVTLRREAEWVNREGVVGRQSRVLQLSKAVDGSLVIRDEGSGFGFLFFIPIVGTQTLWHRFRPADRPDS